MSGLKITFKNIKAIKDATIELADITVLAGVNASGKSTIAKYFHSTLVASRKSEEFTSYYALYDSDLIETIVYISKILMEFPRIKVSNVALSSFVEMVRNIGLIRTESTSNVISNFKSALKDDIVRKRIDGDIRLLSEINRLAKQELKSSEDLIKYFEIKEDEYKLNLKKVKDPTYKTPYYEFFLSKLTGEEQKSLKEKGSLVQIDDGEVRIFDSLNPVSSRKSIYSPKRSVYVDNPALTQPKKDGDWVEIGNVSYPFSAVADAVSAFSSEKTWKVLLGKAWRGHFEEAKNESRSDNGWVFVQEGVAQPIKFADCAEGIKSLSGLDFLDRANLLDSSTLLIVDEPEVHLHPQWIVEYAKMIISMVKEQHVRVLLTTHSPYLIRALRNLSVGELDPGQLRYYVAEKSEESGMYNYRDIGVDIAPIFKIFNVALDEIAYIQG